jgi:hypothetical protein
VREADRTPTRFARAEPNLDASDRLITHVQQEVLGIPLSIFAIRAGGTLKAHPTVASCLYVMRDDGLWTTQHVHLDDSLISFRRARLDLLSVGRDAAPDQLMLVHAGVVPRWLARPYRLGELADLVEREPLQTSSIGPLPSPAARAPVSCFRGV